MKVLFLLVRKSKYIIPHYFNIIILNKFHYLSNINILKLALGNLLSDDGIGCFYSNSQPVNASLLKQRQILFSARINSRVCPHIELILTLGKLFDQRKEVILFQKEHFITYSEILNAIRLKFIKFLQYKIGGPVPHDIEIGRHSILTIVRAIENIYHTKFTLKVTSQRSIDGSERRPPFMLIIRMPKMRSVKIKRFFLVRQKIPCVSWEVFVHFILGNYLLRFIYNYTIGFWFPPDAFERVKRNPFIGEKVV